MMSDKIIKRMVNREDPDQTAHWELHGIIKRYLFWSAEIKV